MSKDDIYKFVLGFRRIFLRNFSQAYGNIKCITPKFIDFETGFPKNNISPPTIIEPFTIEKQKFFLKRYGLKESTFKVYTHLIQGRVLSQLSVKKVKFGGRNIYGRVAKRHRGGGVAQRIRLLDFKRQRKDIYCTVLRVEHDPTRSGHSALVQYDDGVLSYILSPSGVRPGMRLLSSSNAEIKPGNSLPLRNIPVGTIVHNLEIRPGAGGQIARAAGTFATIISKDEQFAILKLSSTEIRKFPLECWATIGQVSNILHGERIIGKAGRNRWLGWKPKVRGVAMNPNIHPHGGGSAKRHTKRPKCSIWGICRDGYKTRCKAKPLGFIVQRKLCGRLQKKYGMR